MKAVDLLGTWSHDALFSPGAQSDYRLHFRSDGVGTLTYEVAFSTEATVFAWSIHDGMLSTRTIATYLSGDDDTEAFELESEDPVLELQNAPVTITTEDTPCVPAMRVLRLPIPDDDLIVPNAFAHVSHGAPAGIDRLLDRHAHR